MMAKCARHVVVVFGFFIYFTTLIDVNTADVIKKNDKYNYYLVSNHQNQTYSYSDLIVINQSDPTDNYQGATYDCLNFISEIKTNERNLIGFINDCSRDCSYYSNNTQLFNEDYIGSNTDYCPGRLRDCMLYEEPIQNPATASLYSFWNWLMNAFVKQDLSTFIFNRGVLLQSVCPTCSCYCDAYLNPNLTGSICLDSVLSNAAEGYVVTGIRFKIIDKIVRLQIQQGKLLDNVIDINTHHWQEINKCTKSKRMNYDYRSIHMDDIILPEDFVITGVSVNLNQNSKGFYLSVYGKPIHELKNINIKEAEYYSPPGNRINLMTPDMESPIAGQGKNVELSIPGQSSISFQTLRLTQNNDLDKSQLMPFLDIRDVSIDDAKLLRGIGIYWRGQEGYGGYIAFKLFINKFLEEVDIIQHKTN